MIYIGIFIYYSTFWMRLGSFYGPGFLKKRVRLGLLDFQMFYQMISDEGYYQEFAGYIYIGTFYRNFIGLDLNLALKEVFF